MVRRTAVGVLSLAFCVSVASNPKIYVSFRGATLKYGGNLRPLRSQGTVLVPARETSKLIGAKLTSDGKAVTIVFANRSVTYEPGHHGYKLNGKRQNMRPASEMHGMRMFVPLRLFTDVTSGKVHAEIR